MGEISFRPTSDDYVSANRAWFWRAVRKPRFAVTLAVGAAAMVIVGLFITQDEPNPTVSAVFAGGMVLAFLLVMAILTGLSYLFQPIAARRLFRQHRTLDRDYVVTWDDAGTRFTAVDAHSNTAWHDYHGWYDGRDVLLLMLNERLFQFIPHRVLTADQLADLRRLAPRAGEPRR